MEEGVEDLTATSSSHSTVLPVLRASTLHTHQRWRNVWPDRRALTTLEDTSVHPGVISGTDSRQEQTLSQHLELTSQDTSRDSQDRQGDSLEVTSAAGWGVGTTAPASPATAPASAWWGSARRSTTTGAPAWSNPRPGRPRVTTQT